MIEQSDMLSQLEGDDADTQDGIAPQQFRIKRLQVYNWGTFSGRHDIPVAERGFLFVGRSGAGKSTLLDAFSALLIPPRWLDFNAAAREAEKTGRDRNLVSYIRGAWAEKKDDASGEIATHYLRSGTTWSALALGYSNRQGRSITLVQVMWLRGRANGVSDVKRQFLIFERDFDITELEAFGQANLDVRKLKLQFPEAFIRAEFRPYSERFRRLLGIDNEMALRLLHKTQSAKNLGDLNTFLREFMLDKPPTFDVAERLVNEFDELNAAHQAVVTARQQVETLAPAREQYQRRQQQLDALARLREQLGSIDAYGAGLRIDLLKARVKSLNIEAEGLQGEVERRQSALAQHKNSLRELEHQHLEAGGERIERWRNEKEQLETQRTQCLRKRAMAENACKQLGWVLPDTPRAFADRVGQARQELEDRQAQSLQMRKQRDALVIEKQQTEKEFTRTASEVRALERQPSNIPAHMLDLRAHIAGAIGVSESALPFVGELIEVKADEADWQGAIERVLHGFALSLVVDERHYAALSQFINDNALGRRLVYYRTGAAQASPARPGSSQSLTLKLNVKPCPQSDWLHNELQRRFDYACVDSLKAFRREARALTREGQVKHSKSRHEKDDRHAIDDRRRWVLGFNNREKLKLYQQQAADLAARIADIDTQLDTLNAQEEAQAQRSGHCQTLVNLTWSEIDAAPLLVSIDKLERYIRQALADSSELKDITAQIERQEELVQKADNALREVTIKYDKVREQLENDRQTLQQLQQEEPAAQPGETLKQNLKQDLDARLTALERTPSLANLDKLLRMIERGINQEIDAFNKNIHQCERLIEKQFDSFINTWRAESEGLDASLDAASDFFAKLTRLESDGLPAHEQRFFELLENQSNQNLAALASYLSDARKEILERMELVNDSLSRVPFNRTQSGDDSQSTYLHIDVSDRQLPEVREFKQEIQQALSHAWSEDREQAEARFLVLRRLVERLSSQESADKRWRNTVLDVRLHMEFIGRELDEGGVEVEVYRSGSGKSGGQRQKLATTCLAAALRYQLGGDEHGVPMYAPVILDEAFDKADNEFTTLAMNIFANFGFQMIVATPLKSVMTLEPFIGGACFIDISDRQVSSILMIEYDEQQQRLKLPAHAAGAGA